LPGIATNYSSATILGLPAQQDTHPYKQKIWQIIPATLFLEPGQTP